MAHLVKFSPQCQPTTQEMFSDWRDTKEEYVNRNRWIVGLVSLAVFVMLVVLGSVSLRLLRNNRQAQVDAREPVPSLRYCSSEPYRPCILSFNVDSQENMMVNILADYSSFPNFYLKIRQDQTENIYKCQKVQGFSTNFSCKGEKMPVGKTLQFLVLSTKEDALLAEGSFPIIGMAVATPEVYSTPTFIPAFDHRPR